jgi:HD-like signal output (HDOD) protein
MQTKSNHIGHLDSNTRARRRSVVTSIERHKSLVLPEHILELAALLTSPAIDLNRVSEILYFEPCLMSQIILHANSACSQQGPGVTRISEAIVLLGAEFVRTVVLNFARMGPARRLPENFA